MQGPYPLDALIERIREDESIAVVGGAMDLGSALNAQPRSVPAVYIVSDERARGRVTGMAGNLIQEIGVTVKCVLWVRNASADGSKAVEDMARLERCVRAKCFGWRPHTHFEPLTINASGADTAAGSNLIRQLLLSSGYRQTTTPEHHS